MSSPAKPTHLLMILQPNGIDANNNTLTSFATMLILALALGSGGCATIVKDDSQPVAFSSDPEGALVSINGNPRGRTPVTVMVKRSAKRQKVAMALEGYETKKFRLGKPVAKSEAGMSFGEIIGAGADVAMGKATNYEKEIYAALRPLLVVDVARGKATNYEDSVHVILRPIGSPPAEPEGDEAPSQSAAGNDALPDE